MCCFSSGEVWKVVEVVWSQDNDLESKLNFQLVSVALVSRPTHSLLLTTLLTQIYLHHHHHRSFNDHHQDHDHDHREACGFLTSWQLLLKIHHHHHQCSFDDDDNHHNRNLTIIITTIMIMILGKRVAFWRAGSCFSAAAATLLQPRKGYQIKTARS